MADFEEEARQQFLSNLDSIATPDENAVYEIETVFSWIDKAEEEGSLSDEHVTSAGITAVVRCAQRNNLIPAEWSTKDAIILLSYWIGHMSGWKNHEQFQELLAAWAMKHISQDLLEKFGIEDKEEEDE